MEGLTLDVSKSPTCFNRFLYLPREIRDHIYAMVLPLDEGTIQVKYGEKEYYCHLNSYTKPDLNILGVCQQISYEAGYLFYGQSPFLFSGDVSLLDFLAPPRLGLLKTVILDTDTWWNTDKDVTKEAVEFCHLQNVRDMTLVLGKSCTKPNQRNEARLGLKIWWAVRSLGNLQILRLESRRDVLETEWVDGTMICYVLEQHCVCLKVEKEEDKEANAWIYNIKPCIGPALRWH